jgi:DNA-binding Lrp family transcriptional regulator
VTPDGRYFLAGLFGEDGVAMLDLWQPEKGARKILENYGRGEEKLPVFKMPHLRGWSVAQGKAYLPAIGRHEVLVVDVATWKEVGRIPVRGQPVFVMARPDGRQVWVNFAFPDNGKMDVIDTLAGKVVHAFEPGKGILHMEFTPRGENVWLSARDDNKVLIYDTASFARVGEFAADSPSGIFFTTPRGAHRLLMDDALEFRLLNEFQRDFPLCPAPFAELAARLGVGERTVLTGLEKLRREGKISRVGAVFAPKRIGASTLAAMAVPAPQLEAVAAAVNRFPEVNHNYEREHRYNLWFVVTAASEGRLQATLGAIEKAAGHPLLAAAARGVSHRSRLPAARRIAREPRDGAHGATRFADRRGRAPSGGGAAGGAAAVHAPVRADRRAHRRVGKRGAGAHRQLARRGRHQAFRHRRQAPRTGLYGQCDAGP